VAYQRCFPAMHVTGNISIDKNVCSVLLQKRMKGSLMIYQSRSQYADFVELFTIVTNLI
jgi:hypothetical protein